MLANTKQDILTVGNNITILDNAIGTITEPTFTNATLDGTVTDLKHATTKEYVDNQVNTKQDTLTAGKNIQIEAGDIISTKDSCSFVSISCSYSATINGTLNAYDLNAFRTDGTRNVIVKDDKIEFRENNSVVSTIDKNSIPDLSSRITIVENTIPPSKSHALYNLPGWNYTFMPYFYSSTGPKSSPAWSSVFRISDDNIIHVSVILRTILNYDNDNNGIRMYLPFKMNWNSEGGTSTNFGDATTNNRGNMSTCIGGVWGYSPIRYVVAPNYNNDTFLYFMTEYTADGYSLFVENQHAYNKTLQVQFSISYQAKYPLEKTEPYL